MSVNYDAVVVGGGVTGCGVARDLSMRGVSVALVERGKLAHGTTGRSHNLLHSGARYADTDPESAAACIQENQVLKEIAGCCVDHTDGLFLQTGEDDPDYFDEKLSACRSAGIPAEELTPDEVDEALADGVGRLLRVPDGVVHPPRLVAANALSAEHHGADVITGLKVTGISEGEVELEDGRSLEARHVVNAAGAWSGQVAGLAGYEVDMRPTRGVMVVVDYSDLGSVLNRCRPPSDGDIVVPYRDHAILGTTSRKVSSPDEYPKDEGEIDLVLEECSALLPVPDDAVDTAYWGVRPLYGERGRQASRGYDVIPHSDRFTSVVGGKLTTYRLMAEATADHVCRTLGIDADCRTQEKLPAVDEPTRLDRYVQEYISRNNS